MQENGSSSLSGHSCSGQSSYALGASGEIDSEGWNCATVLIKKYPPQIILFMFREILSNEPPGDPASSSNQPLASFAWNGLNHLLQDDELGVSTMPRRSLGDNGKLETQTRTLDGQHTRTIQHAESCANTGRPSQNDEISNKQEKRLFCVFDEHKGTSFGKPSDWRRHMNTFHKPGKKQWRCPEHECHATFDKPNNFCQHHRKEHKCRKSCNHADRAKIPTPIKRAFACGYQSCPGLLFSWDNWCNHVAKHMENGMTINQWQYNILLRNLLRRPEVHLLWEEHVAQEVGLYDVHARFTWRPRDTREIKWQLEYMDEVELHKNAESLVLRAYDIGLAVRSAQELLEPSIPIVEPTMMRRPPQHLDSAHSDNSFGASALPRTPQAFQLPPHHSTPLLTYVAADPGSNINPECLDPFDQFVPPFGFDFASWSATPPFE